MVRLPRKQSRNCLVLANAKLRHYSKKFVEKHSIWWVCIFSNFLTICLGLLIPSLYYYGLRFGYLTKYNTSLILGSLSLFLVVVDVCSFVFNMKLLRINSESFRKVFMAVAGRLIREKEQDKLNGSTNFVLGSFLTIFFFHHNIAIAAMLMLILGDLSAALVCCCNTCDSFRWDARMVRPKLLVTSHWKVVWPCCL